MFVDLDRPLAVAILCRCFRLAEEFVGVAANFLFTGRLVLHLLARAKDHGGGASLRKRHAGGGEQKKEANSIPHRDSQGNERCAASQAGYRRIVPRKMCEKGRDRGL